MVALFVHTRSSPIQRRCTGIDQMNKSVCRHAVRLLTCHTFTSLRAPVGTDIMEAGSRSRNQVSQQHRNTIAGIILRCKRSRCLGTIPVESRSKDCFRKVRIRQPVRPLSLSLKTSGHSIMPQSLLMPAKLVQS